MNDRVLEYVRIISVVQVSSADVEWVPPKADFHLVSCVEYYLVIIWKRDLE